MDKHAHLLKPQWKLQELKITHYPETFKNRDFFFFCKLKIVTSRSDMNRKLTVLFLMTDDRVSWSSSELSSDTCLFWNHNSLKQSKKSQVHLLYYVCAVTAMIRTVWCAGWPEPSLSIFPDWVIKNAYSVIIIETFKQSCYCHFIIFMIIHK